MCVAGQIGNQHRVISKREKAGLQAPCRMVEAAAMKKNDGGLAVIEGLAARRCKYLLAIDVEVHAMTQEIFFAARKPASKSALISATSSSPTERRTMSSVIPAALSASASMRECVVVAG